MYSVYKLNKQGDNIQPWHTPFPIWNQSVVPCPVLTVASWPAYGFLKRQVRWSGIPISWYGLTKNSELADKNNFKICIILYILPHAKSWLIGKDSDAGKDWGQEEKGMTKDEMAGWHHGLDGCESGWTPGDGDGQGGLACCDSWGCKESDTTEWLNWTDILKDNYLCLKT